MKILTKFEKSISVLTAFCLLISFVIGPTVANAMTNEEATKQYKQIFKDFMLPYSYGQITSAHYAGTDRVIINIQDLHCHPKVQKNISNIIDSFDKRYGVKKIYLEGAYGKVDTSWINQKSKEYDIPDILDKMLETGRLTGAEYYSAISGKSGIINGLEEKEPYLENLKRFGDIVENQEKINLILNAMDESLDTLRQQYYTKRQYKLEELSKEYKEGTITPQRYYALLSKHIDRLGIDLSKYENTFTYIMLLEMQKNLDYSKITNELQNLILLLRKNLAQSAYQMLVDNTDNFSKMDKLYGYVIKISRQLGLDLTVNFPNLDKYFGYIEFSQKINPLELISEEELLTQEINTRFSETKSQREVVFLINFGRYVKDYVSSKITSSDYEYYKENIETYRKLWGRYVDNRVLNLLDEYIAEADKFYKINTDRNIYFTRNMFGEGEELNKIETEVEAKGDVNKIIENMKGVKEVDVVITGGFHSQTVTEILKNHGVSYIVITPNVTEGTKLAEDTYYQIAREQSKISFQTLANLIASLSPAAQQVIFDALNAGKEKKNIVELTQEERTAALREIIAAKLAESDDTGKIVDDVLKEINNYSAVGLDETFFSKVKPEVFRETWSKSVEEFRKVVRTLPLDITEQSLILIGDTLEKQVSFFTPKQSQEEVAGRKQLATKKTKEIANHYADKFGLGEKGRHILTSFLAGILEFIPMMFGSTEDFIQMHESGDIAAMTKATRILKGIFYATSVLMTTLVFINPLSIGLTLPMVILSGIIPHQIYDLLTPEEDKKNQNITNTKEKNLNIILDTDKDFDISIEPWESILKKAEEDAKQRILEKQNEKRSRKQILLDEIESLYGGTLSRSIKVKLAGMDDGKLEQYAGIIKTLAQYSLTINTNININDIHETLYNLIDSGVSTVFITNLFKAYYSGSIDISRLEDLAQLVIDDLADYKHANSFLDRITRFDKITVEQISFLEELLSKIDSYNEDEIQFLVEQLSPILENIHTYNIDILFDGILRRIDKLNRDTLKFFIQQGTNIFDSPNRYEKSILAMLYFSILFTDVTINGNNFDRISTLFSDLAKKKIQHLALDNDALAIKIFLDQTFKDTLEIHPISIQYRSAIKISRFMSLTKTISPYTVQNLSKIIPKAIETLAEILKVSGEKTFVGKKTKILMANNNEMMTGNDGTNKPRFNSKLYIEMLRAIGISEDKISEHLFEYNNITPASMDAFFDELADFELTPTQENLLVVLRGHGGIGTWFYSNYGYIEIDRVAQAIENLIENLKAKGKSTEEIKKTVESITIDLSCCHSYETAKILKQKLKDRNVEFCPQIISSAGEETVFGYTISPEEGGNLEYAIANVLKDNPNPDRITFTDIFLSEIYISNHTIFMVDDSIKRLYQDFQQYVKNIELFAKELNEIIPKLNTEELGKLLNTTIISSDLLENFSRIMKENLDELKIEKNLKILDLNKMNKLISIRSFLDFFKKGKKNNTTNTNTNANTDIDNEKVDADDDDDNDDWSSAELQSDPTKEWLSDKAKELGENPEYFRFTKKGRFMGVLHEFLPFWKIIPVHIKIFGKEININSFEEDHTNISKTQKIGINLIRILSLGAGILAGRVAFLTPISLFSVAVNPVAAAIFVGLIVGAVTEIATHFIWNSLNSDKVVRIEIEEKTLDEIENINRHFLPQTGRVKLSDSPQRVDGIVMQGVVSELQNLSEEEYEKLLTTKEEQNVLNREYVNAVYLGSSAMPGGRQQGAYVDLQGYDGEIMVVGDIHGRLDKLVQKIEANKDKLASGKMIIVFNGDYVHREGDRIGEMNSSMVTLQYLMRLKVLYPQNVYMIAGNHDIYRDSKKNGVLQGDIFYNEWNKKYETDGDEYTYENLMRRTLALAAETDKYIITHAGPAKGENSKNWRNKLKNISEINNNPNKESIIEYQLLWDRFKETTGSKDKAIADIFNQFKNTGELSNIPSELIGVFDPQAYFDTDVASFAKNKVLIVGHTHDSDREDTFYRQIIPGKNVAIIEGETGNGYGIIDQTKRTPSGSKNVRSKVATIIAVAFFAAVSFFGIFSSFDNSVYVPAQPTETVTQEFNVIKDDTRQKYSTPNIDMLLRDKSLFQSVYETLDTPFYHPESEDDFSLSLEASRSPEIKEVVQNQIYETIERLGAPYSYDNMPEVIFIKTSSTDPYLLGTAWCNPCTINGQHFNFIFVPVNYNGKTFNLRSIDSTVAHEWIHIINEKAVNENKMSHLYDELLATLSGFRMLPLEGDTIDVTFEGETYTLPFYQGMRVLGFIKILEQQPQLVDYMQQYNPRMNIQSLYYDRVDWNQMYRTGNGTRFIAIELVDAGHTLTFVDKNGTPIHIFAVIDEKGNLELETQTGEEFDFSGYQIVESGNKLSISQVLENNKEAITSMFAGFRQNFSFTDLVFDFDGLMENSDGSLILELYDVKNEKKDAVGNEIHVYMQMFPDGTINLMYFDKELIRSDSKGPDLPVSTQEIVTEQEIQEVNPEKTIMGVISSVLTPVQAAVASVLSVFGKKIKIDKDTILVRSDRRANSLPENVTKVDYEISRKALSLFGGTRIGEIDGKVIRVKKKGNSMIFFSKKGLDGITDSQIENMFIQSFFSGMKNLQIKQGTRITFAGEYTAGKQYYSEQDINDRLMNADIDTIQRAEVEISLDLSEEKNIGHSLKTKCINETSSTSTSTIILNFSQLETFLTDVIDLRNMGYRVILRGTIEDIRKAFNYGKGLHMDGAIIDDANEQKLRELETLAADNVIGTTHIETQMYVDMSTATGIDINKVYSSYGIIPIVTNEQAKTVSGKYAMKFSQIKNNIEALFSEGKIINIFCSGKKGERLEDARGILADKFTNMFGTMKELLKPKSPEQRVSEEAMAVSDYNFGKIFYETKGVLVKYLLSKLQEDGNIREILTKEPAELEGFIKDQLADKKSELYEFYKQLPPTIQKRIKEKIESGNYFEAIGTIRGAINQIIDSSLLEHWAAGDKSYDKYQKLRNNFLKKDHKEYRQYIRIRALQLAMNGNDLDALLNERPDTNLSVKQLFETIKTDLNKDVIKTIIEKKYSIKTLDKKEEAEAKTNFMNINTLLEDSIIEAKVSKQLQIPVTAVRNILAAA